MPGFEKLLKEGAGTSVGLVGKLIKSPAKGQFVSVSL
jgi:hypothetical protein